MKLPHLFLLLSALLITTGILLFILSADTGSWLFYISEGFIVLCLIFIFYFYAKVIKTLNALANGMELLNEQDFSSRLALVGQQDADRIVKVFNRMMQQLKDERLRLREQNHFLDLIIKSSPMGVVILDFDNNITSVNSSALQFLGYSDESDILHSDFFSLESPLAQRCRSLSQESTATLRIGDAKIYRCSRLSFVDRGFHHPFILIESLTDEVMIAEKKAYEKVIRMIAHEVNNSVTGVTSTLDSISDSFAYTENSSEMIDAMKICIERCYGLSRFITRFADVVKIPQPILRDEDLNDCITRCKTFMESLCNEHGITLSISLCDRPLSVRVDTSLLEQAIVNIIKNAIESIGKNGNITITTTAQPSPTLVITDNGKGITPDVADRLFTPFFSTKSNGQGLGLIFIREVLLKHNCRFSLRTYDDRLTRFTISF